MPDSIGEKYSALEIEIFAPRRKNNIPTKRM
jgi:hypothetical protein